jgi:hypothetical protein
MEKGDIVGLDVEPKLVHDLIGDWMDLHAPAPSSARHQARREQVQSQYRFTAVTATGYTVAASATSRRTR